MIRRGDTVGVFQLESDGMQRLCRSFGVETIEHVIAIIAIYRPGLMEFMTVKNNLDKEFNYE